MKRRDHIRSRRAVHDRRWILVITCVGSLCAPGATMGQFEVTFPPADSQPPPPMKSAPRGQSAGSETAELPSYGPAMRKTQERLPPPPTTLTVMYKVKYGGKLKYVHPDGRVEVFEQWQSFKSDGYELTRHTNRRLADGNNYQYAVAPLASRGFDPVDIPILYMTGDYEFVLREEEVENLRRFLVDGGTIFFNAARGLEAYSAAVAREMRRVLPSKRFVKVAPDHPIYNSRYRINEVLTLINGVHFTRPPELYSIDIGTRAAAILVPAGLGAAWSDAKYHPGGRHIVGESAIRLGVNLVAYVLGSTEYGRFLAQEFPVYRQSTRRGDVVRFAAVRYAGSWDVNPALQNSLMEGLIDNTGIGVDFSPNVVDLSDPGIGHYPLVFATGHYDFEWSEDDVRNLRGYLLRGGTLFAAAAAGFKPFDIAFRRELNKIFPDGELIRLPPSHPLFASGWNPIGSVAYTPAALRDDPSLEYPHVEALFVDGRPCVLYTPFDLFGSLNRESNAYAKGVVPDDALRIAVNVITYVMGQ